MPNQLTLLCKEQTLFTAWRNVKEKRSSGGIDGVSILEFDEESHLEIRKLADELRNGTWRPFPYWEIEIAKSKNPNEKRELGMTAVRDKIVQHAIKSIIEPRFERLFLSNSYGYRPGKGATKAIRRVLADCRKEQYKYVLKLDIDNYFDTIDHGILQKRLIATGIESEITRLIMLCVQMGKVKQESGKWMDSEYGTPQGAVLSPLLSNLYLHSFDQYAVSRNVPYVRYADDFLFLCETKEQAEDILIKTETYLKEKLKLSLNHPCSIIEIEKGFDFLGITLIGHQATISEKKRFELSERINELEFDSNGFTPKSFKTWKGFSNYYGKLLPQDNLSYFDGLLVKRLTTIIHDHSILFASKKQLLSSLNTIDFLSFEYQKNKRQLLDGIVSEYVEQKGKSRQIENDSKNRQIIQERKREFRKIEAETSGLLINKPGTYVGLTNRGVTISHKGKVIACHHSGNLSQIIITGKGVSLSSNLINFCLFNKIPIDFFDYHGTHLGSILTSRYMQMEHWCKQSGATQKLKNTIAMGIVEGKVKNQHALLKYFHKYHKIHYPGLLQKMDAMNLVIKGFKEWENKIFIEDESFMKQLVGHEAQIAIRYWDYIRELVSDDEVGFERREHHGAQDLMNSMLNYGYSILYARVWQALLAARLNPFESLIHVRQEGKPTLVYDFVEIFRTQVVDRVVVSLIQKGQDLEMSQGLLSDETRKLLVKSIMERLSKYEKYQGEEIKMEDIILRQAKLLAKAFQEEDEFKPYVAKW